MGTATDPAGKPRWCVSQYTSQDISQDKRKYW